MRVDANVVFKKIWIQDLDDDDTKAVLRNRGDGLDDEECPEKVIHILHQFLTF